MNMQKSLNTDLGKWENIPCSWTGRFTFSKKTIISKSNFNFNVVLAKISVAFLVQRKLS